MTKETDHQNKRNSDYLPETPLLSTPDSSDESLKLYDLEKAFAYLGGFGRFQYIQSSTLIAGFITGTFLAYSMSFLELFPKYICTNIETGKDYDCTRDDFCGTNIPHRIDWSADTSLRNWIEDLNMECTPKSQIGLIGSMLFAGWAFSALFIPRLSDIYGRRKIYIISMCIHLFFYIGIILSRNVKLTTAFMFFLGIGTCGRASVGYLYTCELSPKKQQTIVGTVLQLINTSVALLGVIYFFFITKYWIWFQVFSACMNGVVILLTIFVLPESPKYLLAQRKWDELRICFTQMARLNGGPIKEFNGKFEGEVPINENRVTQLSSFTSQTDDIQPETQVVNLKQEEKQLKGTLRDLIAIRRHLVNLLILIAVWVASSFNFYLINFQLKYIKGNVFVNTFISSLSEMPAMIFGGILFQSMGIKITLLVCFSIALVGAICLLILGDAHESLIPVFVLLAKCGVSGSFNICYLANAQIFPAIFAGTAFGMCNIGAKLATIMAPLMAEVDPPVPMIIFTVIAIIAASLAMFIIQAPEEKPKEGSQITKVASDINSSPFVKKSLAASAKENP